MNISMDTFAVLSVPMTSEVFWVGGPGGGGGGAGGFVIVMGSRKRASVRV